MIRWMTAAFAGAALATLSCAVPACAQDGAAPEAFALHAQATLTWQGHAAFASPYRGPQSLDPGARGDETADITLYAGVRPWAGAEVWVNPEIDQGFGLSGTVGVAGFPSGEAYKVGSRDPYLKLQRAFLRQTIDLGGDRRKVDGDLNVLGGSQTADRLVITVGKLSTVDVFDTNAYAHDPRQDFMNWSLIDTGSFDYAADAWGYTFGVTGEWYKGPWTLRAGLFDLSQTPNSAALDARFDQYQQVVELERRYSLAGRPGKAALTAFLTRGRMGSFDAATAQAQASGLPADIAAVRRYQSRTGVSLNLEQAVGDQLGLFLRAGEADGRQEPFEFADIDRTIALGASQAGGPWGRADDRVGLAFVVNDISRGHQRFLEAGGRGILAGDGRLPRPGPEAVLETFYTLRLAQGLRLTADYQFVQDPAYNRDRGPVSILGLRLHVQH